MTFKNIFKLEESNVHGFHPFTTDIEIGLYNRGLITVINDPVILKPWEVLIAKNCRILCFTAMGDTFYFDEGKAAVYFLNVQRAETEFVDRDVNRFFDEFLTIPGVMDKVLGSKRLEAALAYPKPLLKFGQCYITSPNECLGGSGDIETYTPGAFEIYIDLMAQTLNTNGKGVFSMKTANR